MDCQEEEVAPSEAAAQAWKSTARAQGLVCMICGDPPALAKRHEFYDSGLCRACAGVIDADD